LGSTSPSSSNSTPSVLPVWAIVLIVLGTLIVVAGIVLAVLIAKQFKGGEEKV